MKHIKDSTLSKKVIPNINLKGAQLDFLYDFIKHLPKIDLHKHLMGSIRFNTLRSLAKNYNKEELIPEIDRIERFSNSPEPFKDVNDFIRTFFSIINKVVTLPEMYKQIVSETIEDAHNDNVIYQEIRFSPRSITLETLSGLHNFLDNVVQSIINGERLFNVKTKIIISLPRHVLGNWKEKSRNIYYKKIFAIVSHFRPWVVGFDLGGQNEIKHPPGVFAAFFKMAHEKGFGVTIHAGEVDDSKSVKEAITESYANRIGHGIRSIEDVDTLELLREREIPLEICLTSNFRTMPIYMNKNHPAIDFYHLKIPLTLNTDNPSLFNLTLSDDYYHFANLLPPGENKEKALLNIVKTSIRASFLKEEEKRELFKHLKS